MVDLSVEFPGGTVMAWPPLILYVRSSTKSIAQRRIMSAFAHFDFNDFFKTKSGERNTVCPGIEIRARKYKME